MQTRQRAATAPPTQDELDTLLGAIHVTDTVEGSLRDRYRFEGPTPVEVKGKGRMLTYYLEGERPAAG